ncbi:Peptidase M16 inactive domain protein [compost metagenome]
MDYVQHPYFTDQNVEKEKGIIGQEIMMYDDYPDWKVYLNAIQSMYSKHPIKIDITGTIETIGKIDKEILYKCYNTFYNPSNMVLAVCGDFEPEQILEEIKKRLLNTNPSGEIKRIYEEEPGEIVRKRVEQKMEVSQPLYTIGFKDSEFKKDNMVKRHLAVEIILNLIFGKSSELYKRLYQEAIIYSEPSTDYEFSKDYGHVLISGQSVDPDKVFDELKLEINKFKINGLNQRDFDRIKKMIYGLYVRQYNDVSDISRMFISDHFKGINSFDYINEIENIEINYANEVLKEIFDEKNMIISIINKI